MIKIINPAEGTWEQILKRPTATFQEIEVTAKSVFNEIQNKGDDAVCKYTSLFDGIVLQIGRAHV